MRVLDVQLNLQEPMRFPSSVLDAHEMKESAEPGPPALDHCFPEEQNEKFLVNYISDYQLHDVFVDGGDRELYVEQMYKVHWKGWQDSRTKSDWTWEPARNLDEANGRSSRLSLSLKDRL